MGIPPALPPPNLAPTAPDAPAAQLPVPLIGGPYLQILEKHRRQLRRAYAHPNRQLNYDDVLVTLLLAFYNPTLRSLRCIQDASRTAEFQRHLAVHEVCRSTLSDANRVLDPQLLEGLIEDLRARIPDLPRADGKLQELLGRLRLVDGSLFSVAANVHWALRKRKRASTVDDRFVRLNLHLCAGTGLPECLSVTGRGTGEAAEAARHIEPGVIYVADRGIVSFDYIRRIQQGLSDFVLRVKKDVLFEPIQQRELSVEDKFAGVLSDRIGRLVGAPQPLLVREVVLADANNPGHTVRLITSLMDRDVGAWVIGTIYRHRWQIELFFRWLKVHANFEHLISYSPNGLTLGFYVAVIAVLLLYLRTGRRVSKYAYSLLCIVARGGATMEEILPILERREAEKQRERERLARRRAEKTGA